MLIPHRTVVRRDLFSYQTREPASVNRRMDPLTECIAGAFSNRHDMPCSIPAPNLAE
jgi:hypothetical protein